MARTKPSRRNLGIMRGCQTYNTSPSVGRALSEFGAANLGQISGCLPLHLSAQNGYDQRFAWLFAGKSRFTGITSLRCEGGRCAGDFSELLRRECCCGMAWAISLPYRSRAGSPRPAEMFDAPSQSVACRCALRQTPHSVEGR